MSVVIFEIWGQALDKIKCRVLEGVEAADVRVLVLDMQGRLTLDMLGRGIEAALMNPSTLIAEPWQASSETLSGLGIDAMAVDPVLVQIIQVQAPSRLAPSDTSVQLILSLNVFGT